MNKNTTKSSGTQGSMYIEGNGFRQSPHGVVWRSIVSQYYKVHLVVKDLKRMHARRFYHKIREHVHLLHFFILIILVIA